MKKTSQQAQHKQFIDAARALVCDESEEHFDAALKTISKHKPDKKPRAKSPKRVAAK